MSNRPRRRLRANGSASRLVRVSPAYPETKRSHDRWDWSHHMKALTFPISVMLLAALLCSCGAPVGLEETDAFAIVDEFEASISRGNTTREEIHERFGEPAMSREDWRVEVYRSEDEDFFWISAPLPAG